MPNLPPRIQYTARDFNTNLAALQDMVKSRAPEKWNSFFSGDLGSVLLEAIAYDASMLSYILDAQTQECFLDTLKHRESLLHFTRLTGYILRRATASSIQVYARSTVAPPLSGQALVIQAGSQVRSKDGQLWEVGKQYEILPGNFTPVVVESEYPHIKGRNLTAVNTETFVDALVMIESGSSSAVLCGPDGLRFTSDINFGPLISQGAILKLGNEMESYTPGNPVPVVFTTPPNFVRDEFAIIEVGKFSYDINGNSVLFLDRPWDGPSGKFIGKWRIENRNITLVQGETRRYDVTLREGDERKAFQVRPVYYPVLAGGSESFVPSGFLGQATETESGIKVTVSGQPWMQTINLLFEAPDALKYEVQFDDLDRMTITFGDGLFGALIPEEASVVVEYRTGGGSSGNLAQNAIDTTVIVQDPSQSSTPNTVFISNPYTVGRGGQARESLLEAKRNIPQFVRTNDRAVTVDDYAYLASNFVDTRVGRVKLAKGVLHTNTVPREQNVVWVYTWVEGENGQLNPPTYDLKTQLLIYLNERKMITDEVVIVDGITTVVPIHLRFRFSKQVDPGLAHAKVQNAVNSVFAATRPGDTLYLSQMYEAIEAVEEVDFANLYTPTDNLVARNEFELFTNTLQLPQRTILSLPAVKGSLSVVVANPALFVAKGRVGLFQVNKVPTAAIVESVVGNLVTLRSELLDNYDEDTCAVINSDFLIQGWSFERPVNIFVRFRTGDGVEEAAGRAVYRVLRDYFQQTLRPEQPLQMAIIETLLMRISDIGELAINFNAVDSPVEQIVPSNNELITLGLVSINHRTISQ